MNDSRRRAPYDPKDKLFLAGRFVRVEWNDEDCTKSTHLCLFVNSECLRLKPDETTRGHDTGTELIVPWQSIWCLTVLPQE